MRIWAIADVHLSQNTPSKKMDIFGQRWKDHENKIKKAWDATVSREDIVLLAGDISWAMTLAEASLDLLWLHERPGTKVLLRGNHDYWWSSISKVRKELPQSIIAIQNDAVSIGDFCIGGTRLWDNPAISLYDEKSPEKKEEDLKIFSREEERLKLSLQAMKEHKGTKIVMTHYPPTNMQLLDTSTTKLLEDAGVQIVVFGHLHGLVDQKPYLGEKNGVHYFITSADLLDFTPTLISNSLNSGFN